MAAQHTRAFGREAVAVYLAAALVVFGTWAASRYLILSKFENIEQNDISRNIEVLRKALVSQNSEIEIVSRDFARWDAMYTYATDLNSTFEYENFSEAGLDEVNVDLVWVLDPEGKLLSSFENDTDDARYLRPASGPVIAEITRITPLVKNIVDQEGTLRVVQINGVRDRLRVLLVSGEPHAGQRTWRRLLKADPNVDLVHFTILRPPEKDDLTPLNELALIAFPVRELFQVKLREFDLIIFDRFTNRGILPPVYLRNIAEYVRGGGGLLLSVGPEFVGPASLYNTPLGQVLPASPTGRVAEAAFRPRVTELGERHPVTTALPGANAGDADAGGAEQPFVAVGYQHVGADGFDVHPQRADALRAVDIKESRVVAQRLADFL